MRPFEALLLLGVSLALIGLAVPLPRVLRWMRHAAPAGVLLAIAQIAAEGARWQMVPAYVLAMLFFAAWLVRCVARLQGHAEPASPNRTCTVVVISLGTLGWLISFATPIAMPVFRFPHPAGPHGIGTLTYHWVDASRSDIFARDPEQRRQLMVQVWYPARVDPAAPQAAYMPDAALLTSALAQIHHLPAFLLGHFKYVTTHAMPFAPAADNRPQYPVLLFLEGATGFRQMNTFQVEHLVSQGFIVVAIDQPGAAAVVAYPNQSQTAGLASTQFHSLVSPSYLPSAKGAPLNGVRLPNGRILQDSSIIPYLTQDVLFTLDRLAALNRSDPSHILTDRLDLQRVGAFGVSLGGIVVGESCRIDARLQACLIMDAPVPLDVVNAGLDQPSMFITRHAVDMRLERQQSGGWPEAEIEAHQTSMRAAYQGFSGWGYFVRVSGMFHLNFTDMPLWSPLAAQLGLAGPIDGQRAHDIVNAYSLAFFERHLGGRPMSLLEGSERPFSEVTFESRRP
jgi:predicted dienelactone hydrolase